MLLLDTPIALTFDEIVQRARDEARMLGRLRHRNIVRVEDLTVLQGHCAVVMEYLEGVDCKSLINYFEDGSNGDMPLQSMFEVIGNVASALDAAYNHVPLQGGEAMQLVHRDIKPSNVMVTLGGDVKLLDFGTARANFEEREAKTQQLAFGSQAYMAPERFLGDEDTPATDVYSLGVTLYELSTGQLPFSEGDIGEQHRNAAPPDATRLVADYPPALAQLIQRMMAKTPEDRPASAATVAEALTRLLEDG